MGAYHYVLVLFHEPNAFYLIFSVTSKEVVNIGLGAGAMGRGMQHWAILHLLRILFHAVVHEILNPTLPPRLLTLQTSIDV